MKFRCLVLCVTACLVTVLCGCDESKRFEINYSDGTPPGKPEILGWRAVNGGGVIHYRVPEDEDLLSIDASYTNPQTGAEVWFSTSYYVDSITVIGFPDSVALTVQVYAVDRAGNRSASVPVDITPDKPAVQLISQSLQVKGGFGSFYVDWKNTLKQNVNVYLDYSYKLKGQPVTKRSIVSSVNEDVREFVRMEDIPETEPITVNMRVEDRYGNSNVLAPATVYLKHDEIIPKDNWFLPKELSDTLRVRMGFFGGYFKTGGRILIDGIYDGDGGRNDNFTKGGAYGGVKPVNFLVDLGEEWELSRIVTHQFADYKNELERGEYGYYKDKNIKRYKVYIYHADTEEWEMIRDHTIQVPSLATERQYIVAGLAGDMTYFYPDEIEFTEPTRWFRYEMIGCFDGDIQTFNFALSEITLYGRRKR
ncbi:DUF4959 domain-containing protein [Candidatus Symbiothrix dinenymphae]|uniref:DUF4959 domain-containing protein n=1 Tax=Candidatus Symbiothrix dinenymphae TaxID=467085 RepID=UPI0006C5C083|nr:DUF4959 domain-containing protein [Candidatus Symbiothrix dinenymphae]GAP72926.1 hypothetical protein SAMD00024442_5_45 [Candidatus Symbiothrix dinenymphae]